MRLTALLRLTAALALAAVPRAAHAQRPVNDSLPIVRPTRGMVVTRSVRIAPGTYRIAVPDTTPVLTIRGDDVTVDFAGATLEGIAPDADPDRATGIGIRVDGGRNVRVLHARVRGYKVGLLARGTRGLSLIENDFSYNWKPRLFSEIEHESLVDWLSHHRNDHDEWLRFGAGAYLADVHGGEVRGNRIEQGMEGLMLVRTDSVRVWNDTIEFNSGVGIGLYRSSDDSILHNHASFNVRGYSAGFYRRGQDSADLLLYEQSSRNVVAFNSMTHGGDGLFLWAGQFTMDTGRGGSNDNLFYANDFSYAPTNAMEATFSRNVFVGNRAAGSEYGLWGGYSYDSWIVDNHFGGNRTGIAIEHGQDDRILGNAFDGDSTAIRLWADPVEPSDWGYPKQHDTRSRDHVVAGNTFVRDRVALRLAATTGARFAGNRASGVDSLVVSPDGSTPIATDSAVARPPVALPQRLPGGLDPAADPLARLPRDAIVVDEWGPYDWRSPKLWPAGGSRVVPLPLRVLGPPGRWRVVGRRGVARLSRTRGQTGDTVVVTPAAGAERDWELALEYRGEATVSPRGRRRAAGEPVRFSYGVLQPIGAWDVRFLPWPDSAARPTTAALAGAVPAVRFRAPRLDFEGYGRILPGVPVAHVAAVATAEATLGPGTYTLRAISDDAVRVWVDGRLAIDDWAPHESRVDHAPIGPGRHTLRVEYLQVDGWYEWRVEVVRGVEGSEGSPGPH